MGFGCAGNPELRGLEGTGDLGFRVEGLRPKP